MASAGPRRRRSGSTSIGSVSPGRPVGAAPAPGRDEAAVAGGGPQFEPLEGRLLLSAAPVPRISVLATLNRLGPAPSHLDAALGPPRAYPIAIVQSISPDATSPPGSALIPAQVRHAYGFDQVVFGSATGDGSGQTIAIIDAYDYPTALTDVNAFSTEFGLPLFNGSGGPTFARVAQDGTTNYPPTDPAGAGNPNGTWEGEDALDIEWAHATAPMANIILVEANDPSMTNLVQNAANWARSQPGVSVVSMSFSGNEFPGETSYDTYFTTPSGHGGVTFFAASGDTGSPSGYPAYSPNIVAVGGTTLTLNGSDYVSESGWSGSGGGVSSYENQPAYQNGVVSQSGTLRTNPDIAMDADPNTGVAVYDSWDTPGSPWSQVGGTSLATPIWAGLVAVVDQGRALESLPSLDGRTQALPTLYSLPATDFHDITSGNNGFAAGPGYDLVTGLGTPYANRLIYDLGGLGSISGSVFQDNNADGVQDGTDVPLSGVTVYLDTNDNGVLDQSSSATAVSANVPRNIPDNRTIGVTSTLTFSGSSSLILDVNITFSITHTRDADLTAYLIGPDGTQVTLFSKIGGTGQNFTSTTLDDRAATSITAGTAPFTGTFSPSPGLLSAFNGKSALGTWSFKVVDSRRGNTGSIQAWSLSLTMAGEVSTLTDANGQYLFKNVPANTYFIRQVVPANEVQTAPVPGAPPAGANVVAVTGNMTGQSFADFPTVFAASGGADSFYVSLDASHAYVQITTSNAPLAPPTYQVALSLLPSLTFNLTGTSNSLSVDFANGSPVPAGGIAFNAGGASDALQIIGQAPSQAFTLTNSQIGLSGGGQIVFQGIESLWLLNCTADVMGGLTAVGDLHLGPGSTLTLG
jgi:subtilisin-like proprotein convertase family protein